MDIELFLTGHRLLAKMHVLASVAVTETRNTLYRVKSIIRDVLIRVDPVELDQTLQKWNEKYGSTDESLGLVLSISLNFCSLNAFSGNQVS
ncbi:MAG: hypothetical protein DRH24_12110 [Deltaproteobacteria bacterium]|nr:MAG: hypothetical protein DRH24_12110 [Deltaproteobacteria bacterium]